MFWFLWTVVFVCALWAALSLLPAGADAHMPLPYLIALVPLLWVPTIAVAVAAIVMREWGLLCGAIAAGLLSQMHEAGYWTNYSLNRSILQLVQRSSSSSKTPAHRQPTTAELLATIRETRRETDITARETASDVLSERTSAAATINVMTLNCRYGRADAKSIVAMVLSRNITVLALQELTHELVQALNDNGLDLLLPYHQLGEDHSDQDNGGFNGIWIRVDPQSSEQSAVSIDAADVPSITIPVDATRDITFASAHPKSPMRGTHAWSAGIIGLGNLATAATAERSNSSSTRNITVILGDLNSSMAHPSFRALLKSGFIDANISVGQGAQRTFPSWLPWPRIVLDHVIATSGATFTDVKSTRIEHTDHLALTATLTIR